MNTKGNDKIFVLIADDDPDFCFVQKEYLNLQLDMACCGVTHDGKTALKMIAELEPDVVLLDHVMPMLDGLGVLEYAQEHPFPKQPRFLVSSASGQEHIRREMMACGAGYILEKPFEQKTLLKRIRFVHQFSGRNLVFSSEDALGKLIAQKVLAIGVPTKLLGFDYIRQALLVLIQNDTVRPTLKQIYDLIAQRHRTESRCVENAIASAVKAAVACDTPALKEVMALSPKSTKKTVSNGSFLTLLAQSIQLTSMGTNEGLYAK